MTSIHGSASLCPSETTVPIQHLFPRCLPRLSWRRTHVPISLSNTVLTAKARSESSAWGSVCYVWVSHCECGWESIVRPRCVRSKRKQSPSLMSLHSGLSLVKRTSACFIRLQWVRYLCSEYVFQPVKMCNLWTALLTFTCDCLHVLCTHRGQTNSRWFTR